VARAGVSPRDISAIDSDQEKKMKRNTILGTLALVFLFGSAANSTAQVKRVQMHIAGYLCGN